MDADNKLILQWNMQSYRTKFSELKILLSKYSPLCVCLQETRINPNHTTYAPSQYNIERGNPTRDDGHERGVAILVHKRIHYEPINLTTNLQAVAIKLHLNKVYTVCSLYLPHIPLTEASMENLLDQLPVPFILLGDMNATGPLWGTPTTILNQRGTIIENIVNSHSISILNNFLPTHFHIQTNSYSTIDLSLCSSDIVDELDYEVTGSLCSSDHYPILIKWKTPPIIIEKPQRFNTSKANWGRFREMTNTTLNPQNGTIEDLSGYITEKIITAAEATIPKTSSDYKKPPIVWWTAECKIARRDKVRAERAVRRHRGDINYKIAYNRAKAIATRTYKQARQNSWKTYVNSINQTLTLHDAWSRVQRITGKFSPTTTTTLEKENGQVTGSPAETAEILAEHFSHISSNAQYNPAFIRYKRQQEAIPINFHTNEEQLYNQDITELEFKNALAVTQETSPGQDGITYSMIKNSHQTMKNLINAMFNRIFMEGTHPISWGLSIIHSIPKENKNKLKKENQRPISLIDCICKIMEKIINTRLMWFLETNSIIDQGQSGFRRNRSTTDHLVHLEQHIRNAISTKRHTIAVFFDVQKAYDTAWRYGIIKKLHSYGLRGNLPIYIKNFLSNRQLRVRIGATLSQPKPFNQGIPQGSTLSCTCFLIAINDISRSISTQGIHSMLYVDDFTIFGSGIQIPQIERKMQLALNSLSKWTERSGFILSPNKSVCMHICSYHKCGRCTKPSPTLTLSKQPIRCVDKHKFLGLIIDNSLTWKPHLIYLKRACNKTLDLLKKLSHTSWGSDPVTLYKLYIMLLKPKIEYGMEAYASAAKSYIKMIDPIQNAALRIALGAFKTTPVVSLHAETSCLPQPYARQLKTLNLYLRLHSNASHPMHECCRELEEFGDDEEEDNPIESVPEKSFLGMAYRLQDNYHLDLSYILTEPMPSQPPWKISKVHMCQELQLLKKNEYPQQILLNICLDHLTTHSNSTVIYTDGSHNDDGVGYAAVTDGAIVQQRLLPQSSIYTAELLAIRDAVNIAADLANNHVTIVSDSKSAIQAINSVNMKHPIVNHIRDLIITSNKNFCLCWVPSHIGIPGNERADKLANQATTNMPITSTSIPRSDIKNLLKREVRDTWREDYNRVPDGQKLKQINTEIPLKFICQQPRYWATKLYRLRMGHTRLTHEFIVKGQPPPECEHCLLPLTTKHILVDCWFFRPQRQLFGFPGPPSLKEVFSGNMTGYQGPLHNFLHQTGLINKI